MNTHGNEPSDVIEADPEALSSATIPTAYSISNQGPIVRHHHTASTSNEKGKAGGGIGGVMLVAGILFYVHGTKSNDAWFEGESQIGEIFLIVSLASCGLICLGACCCVALMTKCCTDIHDDFINPLEVSTAVAEVIETFQEGNTEAVVIQTVGSSNRWNPGFLAVTNAQSIDKDASALENITKSVSIV